MAEVRWSDERGGKSSRRIKKEQLQRRTERGVSGEMHMWPADTFCHHKHV